jgi:hypothetical protein
MITALRRVLGASSNEDATIIGLDGTEADRNVEVNVQQLTRLLILVHVVEGNHALVELEEVNPVWNLSQRWFA